MNKHGLSESCAEIQGIEESLVVAGQWRSAKRMPEFVNHLAQLIAEVFNCGLLINHHSTQAGYRAPYVRLRFVGFNASAKLAGYAYEVLIRNLTSARRDYLKHFRSHDPVHAKNAGNTFALGWVIGARQQVEQFAQLDGTPEAITQQVDRIKTSDKRIGGASCSQGSHKDYDAGLEAGKEVQLHKPMNGAQAPLMIGQ